MPLIPTPGDNPVPIYNLLTAAAQQATVRVGEGRGFVVEVYGDPLVATAAHCLPFFPPCAAASCTHERTYKNLLGPLNGDSTVWSECYFVDPIADIAVLGPPDAQALAPEADAYRSFTCDVAGCFRVGVAPEHARVQLLSLDGRWISCSAMTHMSGGIWLSDATLPIDGGMSGSPILLADSRTAVGILGTSSGAPDAPHSEGGPQACLTHHLPGWMLRDLMRKAPRRRSM